MAHHPHTPISSPTKHQPSSLLTSFPPPPPPPSTPNSASKCRVSSSNPLECLMKDLKCCICLSIVSRPISLPCNHFFCEICLQQLIDDATHQIRERRKARSNSSLPLQLSCPECRSEFNRRNVVEDPVVRKVAELCRLLSLQPDVRELREKDDSIFDMSQSSPSRPTNTTATTAIATSTNRRPTRSNSGLSSLVPPFDPSAPFDFPMPPPPPPAVTPTKRKLPAALGLTSAAPAAHKSTTAAHTTPTSTKRMHIPSIPVDDSSMPSAAKRAKHTSPNTNGAAASSSAAVTPIRGDHSRPTRAAVLNRRSYKDPETQFDESCTSSQDGGLDVDGCETLHGCAPTPPAATESGEEETSFTLRRTPHTPHGTRTASTPSPPSSAYKTLKDYPPVPIPFDGCAVCGEVTDEEAVVECKECKVKVHAQLCYGSPITSLTPTDRLNWYCDRCSPTMGTKHVSCCVCPNMDDQAFKKTDRGGWIHASCATWLPGPRWKDPSKRNMVCDINRITKDRYQVQCKFCTGKGAIVQCTYGHDDIPNKCVFGYHVPCGVRFGILYEFRGPDEPSQIPSQMEDEGVENENDDIFFHSFCKRHQPLKDMVTNCNSAVSQSARKKKQREKKKKAKRKQRGGGVGGVGKKGKSSHKTDSIDGDIDMKGNDSESDVDSKPSSKRVKRDVVDPVNRSINLADTSLDTSIDSVSTTPSSHRRIASSSCSDAIMFQSLFGGPSTSPFGTPAPAPAPAAGLPSSSTSSTKRPLVSPLSLTSSPSALSHNPIAARKLAFSTPCHQTITVGVATRTSPSKVLPPMVRSASAGALSSSQTSLNTPIKSDGMMTTSIRQTSTAKVNIPAAAASISSTPLVTVDTPSRAPLRSMAHAEVSSRDNQAPRNNSISPSTMLLPKRTSHARRHIVLLGTKLDSEQQALLEELATVLNEANVGSKEENKKSSSSSSSSTTTTSSDKLVYVQHHYDDSVTHVITSARSDTGFILEGRTVKYFQGLLGGTWVLGVDWIGASLCARKTMPEQDYLVMGDSKLNHGEITQGAKRARNQTVGLFKGLHFVWRGGALSKQSTKDDALKLIQLGGGELSDSLPGIGGSSSHSRRRARGGGGGGGKVESHDSDLDEPDSQMDDSQAASPIRPSMIRGMGGSHLTTVGPGGGGSRERWFLLVDDMSNASKRSRSTSGLNRLKELVSSAEWQHCVENHIDIVGVNWLFDSISAYKLQPTEKIQANK